MDQPWQIELFGWLRATQGDQVVARFRTQKAGALLAYLAFYLHRSHPRNLLIELLWPESEPRAGHTNLRTELTSLRRQLELPGVPPGAVLLADRTTLRLNPAACVTDVACFELAMAAARRSTDPAERVEHLTHAAELYRGELLPGWFEDWVLPERQRLVEAFLQGVHELVALLEGRQDVPGALRWARRAVAADPLGEESHHLLIRLLLESGQVEAARSQFEQSEHLIRTQLGTGLSPEIRALVRDRAPAKDRPPAPDRGRRAGRRRVRMSPGLDCPPGSEPIDEAAGTAPPTQAATARPSDNLPLRFTRFFGRETEIATLCQAVGRGLPAVDSDRPSVGDARQRSDGSPRLVTLVGPGGTGKTSLALQAAQQLRNDFAGGVWFVSLRDLADPALIPDQILLALRLQRSPHTEAFEQVASFLSRAPALLVLDNYEHLVDRGAEVVRRLLEHVEHLTVLVTSRRCLALEAEREFPVAPLPVPGDRRVPAKRVMATAVGEGTTPDPDPSPVVCRLSTIPSVQLFVDRAQAVRPDFQVTPHNAAAVATLCRRLEGLPLAVELAAARSGVLTPQQMLSRLEQRFELLVGRGRSADPRHRSLRAALDWSYQLLPPELRSFFARLSIFRGGWSFESAEVVCDEPRALEYLEHLRESSLVLARETAGETAETSAGAMRFDLLETLREYGAGQLAEDERCTLARRHLQFFLNLAETTSRHLQGPEPGRWLEQLEREIDNFRAALAWSRSAEAESGDLERGLQLGGLLVEFWSWRGYHREARQQLLDLLAQPGAALPTVGRAMALGGAAYFVEHFGDRQPARELCEECLAIRTQLGDLREIAGTLVQLGQLVESQGDRATGRALLEESLAIRRRLDDRIGIASSLNALAWLARREGEQEAARALAEESLEIGREIADWELIHRSLDILGGVAATQRELPTAWEIFHELLEIHRARGDQSGVAVVLNYLAEIAHQRKELPAARALAEESLEIHRNLGNPYLFVLALQTLGSSAFDQRDLATARAAFEESLAIQRKLGDQEWIACLLNCLAEIARQEWDIPAARALAEEGLAIRREVGDPRWIADSLHTVGWIHTELGDREAARAFLEEGLAIGRKLGDRVRVFRGLDSVGSIAFCQGDLETTRALFEENLAVATELNEKSDIARALTQMGRVTAAEGDYPASSAFLDRALALWRELDEPSKRMTTLFLQGWMLRHQGQYAAASAAFSEMLAIAREHGWRASSITPACLLGEVAGDRGDWHQAAAHFADGIMHCRADEMRYPLPVVQCLSGMARVSLARVRPERAARLLGAAATLWREGAPYPREGGPYYWEIEPGAREDLDRSISTARAQLDETRFADAWAQGQAMPIEQAIAEALQEASPG